MARERRNPTLEKLQAQLQAGEAIQASVSGEYQVPGNPIPTPVGIVAATDRRVIIFTDKIGGFAIESFQYRDIASSDYSKSFMGGEQVSIVTPQKRVVIRIRRGDSSQLMDAVNAGIERSQLGHRSVADELSELAALRDEGTLTDDDWARAKGLFLGKQPSDRDQAVEHLRKLYELHKAGVLSESEFNSKKWDVLAADS